MKKESIVSLSCYFVLYVPFAFILLCDEFVRTFDLSKFYQLFISDGNAVIFVKSVLFSVLASVLSSITGFFVAFIVTKSANTWLRFFSYLYILPLIIPGFVYIEAVVFLSELSGKNLFSIPVLIILQSVVYLPISAIIIGAGFRAIPRSFEESAIIVTSGTKWFFNITLQWMRPYFFSAFIITFLFVFSNYEIPSLMNAQTYTLFIFNQFGAFYNYQDALYLIIPVFVLYMLIATAGYLIIGRRAFFDLSSSKQGVLIENSTITQIIFSGFLIFISIIILLPFAILVFKASSVKLISGVIVPFWQEILYSLLISVCGAVVAIFIATLLVRNAIRFDNKIRNLFLILAFLPFAIPPAFFAVGLIKLSSIFGTGAFCATVALIWGLAARYLPIVFHIIYASAVGNNPHILESADLTKRSWLQKLIKIWIPLNMNVIVRAFFFFTALSMAEIGLAVFLVPPDNMTASLNIYSMLHYGFGKEVAAESLFMLSVIVILGLITLRNSQNRFRKSV